MRARSRITSFALAGLCTFLAGCDALVPTACTLEARFGIVLSVVDARTGATPPVGSALTVRDGSYVEQLPHPDWPDRNYSSFVAAIERPGRYDLTIVTPGYRTWTRAGVRVATADCHHVQTRSLVAQIEPL